MGMLSPAAVVRFMVGSGGEGELRRACCWAMRAAWRASFLALGETPPNSEVNLFLGIAQIVGAD